MKQLLFFAVFVLGMQTVLTAQVVTAAKPIRKGMPPISKTVIRTAPPPRYDVRTFNGKWQEVRRMNASNVQTSFADTLMLMINNGRGQLKSSNDMNMVMNGDATVESDNMLNIAGTDFNIMSFSQGYLTLKDDDNMTRVMRRVKRFYGETVGKDSIKLPVYTTPVNADPNMLSGKWDVYRRDAEPGFITSATTLIKSISFNNISGNSGTGEMMAWEGSADSYTVPIKFTLDGSTLTVVSDKQQLAFSVYKADGKEFVFGKSGALMTYAKH